MASELAARARRDGTPLVERGRATFVWRGTTAPKLMGDWTDWEARPVPLRRAADRLWTRSVRFPDDAYVEYAFLGPRGRIRDPLARDRVWNGVGAWNQSFYMPAARPTPLVRRRPGVPRGTLTRHSLLGEALIATRSREVVLYAPAASGPWPLLVVFDGNDYLRRGRLATIVDHLVTERRIRPIAMACVRHGGPARVVEYGANEVTLEFVTEHVLPLAREHLDLDHHYGAHALLGASMGGLMSVFAALRRPDLFGATLSQSGAFAIRRRTESVVFDLARHAGGPVRVWMDAGRLEFLLDANRRFRRALAAYGHDVTYREFTGGHNWTSWRNDVTHGLEAIFGV